MLLPVRPPLAAPIALARAGRLALRGRAWWVCAYAAVGIGCVATPPPGGSQPGIRADGGAPRFATIGRCSAVGACPGPVCGALAQGAPDGRSVELRACGVLDLYFTGGTVVAVPGGPSLALHLGRFDLQPAVRVEASRDGTQYVDVGFLNAAPSVDARCVATRVEGRLLLDLAVGAGAGGGCRAVAEVAALRLSTLAGGSGGATGGGTLELDAVEALEGAFRPAR